ncbi:hypothetical protein PHYPSEUDO_011112 [Phytophthora pseudosyringae]|uniref:Uncharacterized protein n=1 Tax=Phytophthora pseudosyringae TaxID=221518 RepID=A0A8T1WA86_9STRA|nr:hypothetical protein PHYPSEUDO_011112 [Phytophthora pseudosyringae]
MVGTGNTGNERTATALVRHHAVLEPHFNGEVVSERVQAAMKRRRRNLDTFHVARLSLSMLVEPAVRPRPKGDVTPRRPLLAFTKQHWAWEAGEAGGRDDEREAC